MNSNDDQSLAKSKELHLIHRMQRRDQTHDSVLSALGIDENQTTDVIDSDYYPNDEVRIDEPPPTCSECKGQKFVLGMFYKRECDKCKGTGFDLSNAIAVIKWQNLCLDWSKMTIKRQRHDITLLATSDEEREEKAQEKFYRHARLKD